MMLDLSVAFESVDQILKDVLGFEWISNQLV